LQTSGDSAPDLSFCGVDKFADGFLICRTKDIAIWPDQHCRPSSEEEIETTIRVHQVVDEDRLAPASRLMRDSGQQIPVRAAYVVEQ